MTAPVVEDRRPGVGRLVAFLVLLTGVAWGLAAFSAYPWLASPPGAALLKVAFKHVAPLDREGRQLSREELEKLPRHMRPEGGARATSSRRRDTVLRVALDGRPLLERTYHPSGLRRDGPTFAYEELPVPTGRHRLTATLADGDAEVDEDNDEGHLARRLDRVVEFPPGRVVLLELSEEGLVIR